MRSRQDAIRTEAHARGKERHVKAQRSQRRREQRVLLEAVAATAAGDELGLQAFEIEPDRPAEEDVQILERNMRRVRKMQRLQRGQRRLARAAVVDAPQISVEIEGPG